MSETTVFTKAVSAISQWLGVTSTLVATATAIFTTHLAVSVNERNARDRFFEKQLQTCTDLGDAVIPLQRGLTELLCSPSTGIATKAPLRGSAKFNVCSCCTEQGAGPQDFGLQALIRGLVTAFPCVRLGLPLSRSGRRLMPAT